MAIAAVVLVCFAAFIVAICVCASAAKSQRANAVKGREIPAHRKETRRILKNQTDVATVV